MLCKDLLGDHLVGKLDVCRHIALGVVGGGAPWQGARKVPLPRVSLNVVQQAELDVELFPTRGTLKVLIVAGTLLLAVLPPLKALEILPTIRAERARRHLYYISCRYIYKYLKFE